MNYEDILKTNILPELEAGRPDFDKPHTIAVVEHIKGILKNTPTLKLNKDVLIIAAYAHDWGYAGLFENGKFPSLDDVNNAKEAHMVLGAEKLSKLLNNRVFDFLTREEKDRAVYLVMVHDQLASLKDQDEIILMEADTLGGLDVEKAKPTFDKDSNARYMEKVRVTRLPMFITDYGKQMFEKLYQSRVDYYNNK